VFSIHADQLKTVVTFSACNKGPWIYKIEHIARAKCQRSERTNLRDSARIGGHRQVSKARQQELGDLYPEDGDEFKAEWHMIWTIGSTIYLTPVDGEKPRGILRS